MTKNHRIEMKLGETRKRKREKRWKTEWIEYASMTTKIGFIRFNAFFFSPYRIFTDTFGCPLRIRHYFCCLCVLLATALLTMNVR